MHALESIALIGLRGSGKTSLGKRLAKELGFSFADTDEIIQNRLNQTVSAYVSENGWEAFRDREEEILLEMPENNAIISCGGGIVLRERNRELLKRSFFTVFLDIPVPELVRRLQKDTKPEQRPAFTDKSLAEEMQELYDKRIALYLEACSFRLTLWRGFDLQAETILREYQKRHQINIY